MGIRERPSIEQALEVLEDLRSRDEVEALKKIVTKVYSYINDLISHDHGEQVDWQKYHFLTKNGHFSHPNDAYFEDDEEYAKKFRGKVEFVSLPFFSWVNLSSFLKVAGFKSFAGNLSVKKCLGEVSELEGGEVGGVTKALSFVKAYLLSKNLKSYEGLQAGGMFDELTSMEIYETSKIKLNFFLKEDESEIITVTDVGKEAYYSKEENRLYILKGTNLFSGKVAKELSRMFRGAENDVFPFLNSILPKADDEEVLEAQLQLFGIEEGLSYSGIGKVELLPEEEKPESEKELKEEPKEGDKEKEEEGPRVEPPIQERQRKGLIDPDEYYPSTSKEYSPYKKTEGEAPKLVKEIKLKEGKPGFTEPDKEPQPRTGTKDAEGTAIRMVLNYENGEGRKAEDRHKQKGIGYDIYSKDSDGGERFIEVITFR